ncbi:unnamed protein product [Dibothriocephalus latus]|uniref:Amino acid transporter n=1 Tax=Dibothriocephalus latus TaxID=60516 RepID=A0A3P7NL06_DIBLA|nr:unnamed protein product [Dibothriocephalus latus]
MSLKKTADSENDSVVYFNDTDDELTLENENQKKGGCVGYLRENLFVILILIGVAVGFGIGFGVRQLKPSPVAITWIGELLALSLSSHHVLLHFK